MKKVIAYIDGFNLYFGLKRKNWKRYYWLNVQKLSENLLTDAQSLMYTKYFTARISYPPEKVKRQNTFLEALETLNQLKIYYGKYQMNNIECKRCGNLWAAPNEKMTDVNISIELLSDALQNNFDIALLISGDSDLSGPLKKIHELFLDKRTIVAFPPATFSFELSKAADAYFTIGRKKFADSVFPDEIVKDGGYFLKKPVRWS